MRLSELIKTLAKHYMPNKKIVQEVAREMVLDLRWDNIEKVFTFQNQTHTMTLQKNGVERTKNKGSEC